MRELPACGALVALAALAAGCGGGGGEKVAKQGCLKDPPPQIADDFKEPPVRTSKGGVLETTLKASYSPVEINGRRYKTLNYEGTLPGPTLIVCPGDKLVVHLENDLGAAPHGWKPTPPFHHVDSGHGQLTNLHVHGLHVSPSGNHDNVFLSFEPGQKFTYEYSLPPDEPPGLYWYHPHRHGYVEAQVYAGMFGAIYVQGGLDTLPEIRDIPTRTLIINSLQLGNSDHVPTRAESKDFRAPIVVPTAKSETAKSPYFVNGELDPDIHIRPGEIQRWRLLNLDDNAIVRLSLPGYTFYVLANDGNTLDKMVAQQTLLLGPAERREVLVQGGPAGSAALTSEAFEQFQDKNPKINLVPASTIATIRSSGSKVDDKLPTDVTLGKPLDVTGEPIAQRHKLVFTEQEVKTGYNFLINSKVFDPKRVDETMKLGEVNEWTLVNKTKEWHSFHIHINDFQLTSVVAPPVPNVSSGPDGVEDLPPGRYDPSDTVMMPPGSTVKFLTKPTDFTGKFVYHCHMLYHEDHGMMGVVEVLPS